MSTYVFLACAFIFNAAANILLKIGANKGFSFMTFLKGQWNMAHFYAGLAVVLFALNLAFYLMALKHIPLSVAYPIMIGMTFLITIAASIFLGERINITHAFGILLIFAGILLAVQSSHV